MTFRRLLLGLTIGGFSLTTAAAVSPPLDFAVGRNAEGQACRAQARFGGPASARQVDLYCGEWERPSGQVTTMPLARRAEAEGLLQRDCSGAVAMLASGDFSEFRQVNCGSAAAAGGIPRFGLIAVRGGEVVVGAAYPSDWDALVQAARVLTGAASASSAASAPAESPGLREIQSVFPAGAPGQSAAANYELLRRRAYEKNAVWNFGGSQSDFAELLRLHRTVAPDDSAGEAEILAELSLNLSGEERFDEASETLSQARALAANANEGLLLSKLENYRAIHLLNQRRYAEALDVAVAANADRSRFSDSASAGVRITAADVAVNESRRRSTPTRALLFSMGAMSESDRAAVLSAQGAYLAGVAAQALHRPDAERHFNEALGRLSATPASPDWLRALTRQQLAVGRLSRGDAAGAVALAQAGLIDIRSAGPGTRTEAHLLLTLGAAQRAAGQSELALVTEQRAVAIFASQRQRPGLPADLAGEHLSGLVQVWEQTRDPAWAARYLETISLIWDGAAARSASQLAARLATREVGTEARSFQDAERGYRAALARRQRLALAENVSAQTIAAADADIRAAATRQTGAEQALRARSPRFLELLSPGVSAVDLRGALALGEGYLRIVTTSTGSFGVLVTSGEVTPFRVNLTASQADALAQRLRRSSHMQGRRLADYDLAAAFELYTALMGPVSGRMASLQRLQVDVGGSLAAIPLSALLTQAPTQAQIDAVSSGQDYSGLPWLSRQIAVAQSVGPASFVRIRRSRSEQAGTAPATASIFGDFTPAPRAMANRLASLRNLSPHCRDEVERAISGLQALPDTAGEARQVAALFGASAQTRLAGDFTDERFFSAPEVGQASVILLATHGVLGLSSCLAEPALIASMGQSGDGLIEASELLDRQLQARLVVLSACDTAGGGRADVGRSGLSDGGEALSGLARGFLYAGASSVLATQWQVDSATSATQVMAFFQAALQGGQPLSIALQTAQRQVYSQSETGHPFYWAAFSLIGDGSTQLRASQTATR